MVSVAVVLFQTDVYTLGRVYLQLCAALHLTIPLLGETTCISYHLSLLLTVAIVSLHCVLSLAVQCNRSCLWVCVFVFFMGLLPQ